MDTKRQQKFSKMLLKELSQIFMRDLKGAFGKAFITITHVDISPDLTVAKVFVSIMLASESHKVLQEIESQSKKIRQLLGAQIRHQARIIPELVFYLDDSAEYAVKIEKVIAALHVPKPEQE